MKSQEEISNETVALIEVGGSHDECLLTQLHALQKAGCSVVLICTQEIRERNPIFENYVDDFYIANFGGSKTKNFGEIRRVLRFMEEKGVSRAVMNTAQGSLMRNLSVLAVFSPIEFTGVIHTTRKFRGSFTQRVITRKVKKYLLLSEYLLSTVEVPKGVQLDYFYPIRFDGQELEKVEHEGIEVTIIGGVEKRRKDLIGFCEMLKNVPSKVHFTFLGKSDPKNQDVREFEAKLAEINLKHKVTLYTDFVSHGEFIEQLRKTDAILTLIHPETPSADQYFKNQIAGAMSVAFGFKIPLLLHENFGNIEEMKPAAIYYLPQHFERVLDKKTVRDVEENMRTHQAYDANYQEQRYLDFLFTL